MLISWKIGSYVGQRICGNEKELHGIMGSLHVHLTSHITRNANLLTGRRLEIRSAVNGEKRVDEACTSTDLINVEAVV